MRNAQKHETKQKIKERKKTKKLKTVKVTRNLEKTLSWSSQTVV